MPVPMPDGYYSRHNPANNYDQHLFIAGFGLQSAELNEIQQSLQQRVRGVADALFKDGDIIRDAQLVLNSATGECFCESGAVYLAGAVRGVPPKTITVPIVGQVVVGIRMTERVITSLEDPSLLDPAQRTRNYQQPGAARLMVETEWAYTGDGVEGEFFPVYTIIDGVLLSKEPPPQLDSVTNAIAAYDRDNSGGTYVVNGLTVEATPSYQDGIDSFVVASGRARISGYAVSMNADARVNREQNPDVRYVSAEPHMADGNLTQRIVLDRAPAKVITELQVTREKSITVTRGLVGGGMDNLPDTSVLKLVSVTQGGTTYTVGTHVRLTGGRIDWSLTGPEPAGGSTYNVVYQYIATEVPADGSWDEDSVTVTGAVPSTLILVSYQAKLPRIDRLCLTRDGKFTWATGISDDFMPRVPEAPPDAIPLARVIYTWRNGVLPRVLNDAVRTVSMGELQAINGRIDLLADIIARNQLATDANLREAGLKKGLLVDPFVDNSVRDLGIEQDATIAFGALSLPIEATAVTLTGANQAPNVIQRTGYTVALKQESRTGGMKVNPYMSIVPVPAVITLDPAKDYWTETKVRETSSTVEQNITTSSAQTAYLGTSYYWGWGSSWQTYAGSNTSTSVSTSSSSNTSITKDKLGDIENLRQIDVSVTISGFGPNEKLDEMRFDGLLVTPTAL